MKMLTYELCNPNLHILLSERVNRIESICNSSVFSVLFKEKDNPHVSIKASLVISLFKNRQYKMGYGLYFLHHKLKM